MKRPLIPALATRVGASCALAILGGALGSAPSSAASLVVQTEDGAVQGNVALGVENFLKFPMRRRRLANCAGARPNLPRTGAM